MSNLNTKIEEILNADDWADKCEALGEAFLEAVETDGDTPRNIGRYMLKAYLNNSVDDFSIATTGWCVETLLVRAGLIPDEHGVYLTE